MSQQTMISSFCSIDSADMLSATTSKINQHSATITKLVSLAATLVHTSKPANTTRKLTRNVIQWINVVIKPWP